MLTATRTSHVQNGHRLTGVTKVNENDIICGRSGLSLKQPGNMAYRKMVGMNKELYATCPKTEKLVISKSIVAAIRGTKVRFLEREDGKTGQTKSLNEKDEHGNPVTWKDIGDKRAVEKTSQALREGQPKLLRKLSQQQDKVQSCHVGGGVQVQVFGHQPPVQDALQAMQQPSFTSVSSVDVQIMLDGLAENSLDNARYSSYDSQLDSWGSEDPVPLPRRDVERSDSKSSPLPYLQGANNGSADEHHVLSSDDHQQLMMCLSVDGRGGSQDSSR